MPAPQTRSDWQLPPGVTQGSWQYTQADFIAEDYDAYFSEHGMMSLDRQIVDTHLRDPGVVVDFGCGTGRSLIPLVHRGFTGVGVDLSQPMLEVLQRKAKQHQLPIRCVRANLVELDCLPDAMADYSLCLFSTLGMIEGAEHRLAALRHFQRVLKPGGLLVLHVHNFWHNAWLPLGRGWVMSNLVRSCLRREPRGDKRYDYRGIRNFFLHVFTRRELQGLVRAAGFKAIEWHLVGPRGDAPLQHAWCAGNWRAQGWIVVCRKDLGIRH